MAGTPTAGKESVEIDRLRGAATSLADHRRERTAGAVVSRLLDFLEQLDKLGERNFTTTSRGKDGGDLALVDPAVERCLADV